MGFEPLPPCSAAAQSSICKRYGACMLDWQVVVSHKHMVRWTDACVLLRHMKEARGPDWDWGNKGAFCLGPQPT